jgi:hypothetical protein
VRSVRWMRMTHASVVARFHARVVVYSTPGRFVSGVRSVAAGSSSGGEGRSEARRTSFESVAGSGRVLQYLRCAGK